MQCPYCKKDRDRVVDSRTTDSGAAVRRRRQCIECGRRFTTYERLETAPRFVLKMHGGVEEFRRDKVLAGLERACEKLDICRDVLESIVDSIECDAYPDGVHEVSSGAIGKLAEEKLLSLHPVAHLRFRSVYRKFTKVGEFLSHAEELGSRA